MERLSLRKFGQTSFAYGKITTAEKEIFHLRNNTNCVVNSKQNIEVKTETQIAFRRLWASGRLGVLDFVELIFYWFDLKIGIVICIVVKGVLKSKLSIFSIIDEGFIKFILH